MKRLFSLVTLCLFVAFEASATVYVCKEEVGSGKSFSTSSSSGISLSGGTLEPSRTGKTAKISRSGNTITIEWAKIVCIADNSAMRVEEDGITIKFVGDCWITATKSGRDGLQINKTNINTTIKGDGYSSSVLTLTGKDSGIYIKENSKLTVKDINFFCNGNGYGVYGQNAKATLAFEGNDFAFKSLTANTAGVAIANMASVVIPSGYNYYRGCYFNNSNHCVCDIDGNKDYYVIIAKEVDFGLSLFGYKVTNCNYDVIGKFLKKKSLLTSDASTIAYDYENNKLTLNNATLTGLGPAIDNYGASYLVINVSGTNNLTATSYSNNCVDLSENTYISGSGTLNLKASEYTGSGYYATYAIRMNNSQKVLHITNATVNCSGGNYGINGSSGNLALDKCKLSISSTLGAVSGWNSITFTGNDIATQGYFFNPNKNAITNVNQEMAKKVDVKLVGTEYGFSIMGRKVNDLNCNSFACQGMTNGTIKYDNSSGTLTLNNVTINCPSSFSGNAIDEYSTKHIKTISLYGNNSLTSSGNVFSISGNVTFTGQTASLTANSTSSNGYYVINSQSQNSANIVINVGGKVKFFGKQCGIRGTTGLDGFSTTLELKKLNDSDYSFRGTDAAAVGGVSTLTMTGMDFYSGSTGTPGCFFNNNYVRQNGGNIVKGNNVVEFRPITTTYNLSVGGTPVTNCNMLGIGSKYITSGGGTAAVYDQSTQTLKLNNAVINTGSNAVNGIRNNGLYLKINATSSSITSNNANSTGVAIYCSMDTQINGSLDLKGNAGGIIGNNDACIWFNDCTMNISDGISGYDGKALLRVTLPTQGRKVVVGKRVEALTDLILESGKITKPVGGKFDKNVHAVVDQNGNKANGVTFEDRYATAIDAIEVANDTDVRNIYDATGRESGTAKRGLNIIRMSDGTIRKVMVK